MAWTQYSGWTTERLTVEANRMSRESKGLDKRASDLLVELANRIDAMQSAAQGRAAAKMDKERPTQRAPTATEAEEMHRKYVESMRRQLANNQAGGMLGGMLGSQDAASNAALSAFRVNQAMQNYYASMASPPMVFTPSKLTEADVETKSMVERLKSWVKK
jgi:hypothetical protein